MDEVRRSTTSQDWQKRILDIRTREKSYDWRYTTIQWTIPCI